jgi:hypothetical protein
MMKTALAAFLILALNNAVAGELPNPILTPGAVNETISLDDYKRLCHETGWTKLYRPPPGFTNALKRLQMKQYGYADRDPREFEMDHLLPLCLSGAPQDPHNLWPQPRAGEWSAEKKEQLEIVLCRAVCRGDVDLKEAQHDIAQNWIAAYKKYVHHQRASRRSHGS